MRDGQRMCYCHEHQTHTHIDNKVCVDSRHSNPRERKEKKKEIETTIGYRSNSIERKRIHQVSSHSRADRFLTWISCAWQCLVVVDRAELPNASLTGTLLSGRVNLVSNIVHVISEYDRNSSSSHPIDQYWIARGSLVSCIVQLKSLSLLGSVVAHAYR